MRQLKPALQYSEGRSKPWSGARLVNCFSEKSDGDKRTDFAIMAIPGLDVFVDTGESPIRGSTFMGDTLYVVAGSVLFSIASDGVVAELGIIPGGEPVRMVNNGAEIAICATPHGYVWSAGALRNPSGLYAVEDVAYIDGYFVWVIWNSDQCQYSGINDGLSYDALDVFTAEGAPDGLVGIINDHRELQLYGQQTIEIFYNSGGADNAFERQGNAFIERGCFDKNSIIKIDNSVHFLGDDRIVYRLDGYSPVRISTHAIEYRLRNSTFAQAFTYTEEGHKFYCLTVDDGTFCYDMATGAWHERRSWEMERYRVGGAITAWGEVYLLDGVGGRIFVPNFERYDEAGEIISMAIDLPTLEAARERVTMYAFEVECETGIGPENGSNPQIMMKYSDDGGRTWSNELWRGMGVIGTYRTRAIWRSLGQFRTRQIRLTITDSARRFVMNYWADVR